MSILSQNKKIALCAGFVFTISFATMVFFLEKQGNSLEHVQTDVIHAEENTSEEAGFRKIAGDSEDPLVVINAEGKVEFGSEDFCKLLKVGCDELKEALLFDYIHSKDLSKFASDHSKIVHNGEKKEGIGPYRIVVSGEEILAIFNAYPVLDGKKVSQIILTVRDLTDQVESINSEDEGEVEQPKWIRKLYPRIKEEDSGLKLVVDKV